MAESKVTWGLYDEFGNLLPQDPSEGPDKSIPYDLDKFRCDICGSVLTTHTGLSKHRATHFQPHNMDWSQFSEQMKKRKLERDEEQRAKKRKLETEADKTEALGTIPVATGQSNDVESDETEELTHSPCSSVRSTPVTSPAPSNHSPVKSGTTENSAGNQEKTREMLIKEAKKRFNSKQIAAELVKRKALTECICGIFFEDFPMYILHRGLHHTENPLQCSHCKYVAPDQTKFMVHFFKHKKTS